MNGCASGDDWLPVTEFSEAGPGALMPTRKICLLGDPAVGKSSLVLRMAGHRFNELYVTTVGARVLKKTVSVRPHGAPDFVRVPMMIWEITGHIQPEHLHPYLVGADAAMVVGDAARVETQERLSKWITAVRSAAGDVPVMMLVNKTDINYSALDPGPIERLASEQGCTYRFTSARTGSNVDRAFSEMATRLALRKDRYV